MKIKVHSVDSIAPDVEVVHHRIEARATQVYDERGEVLGQPLEDWLAAERETVWRPTIEVQQVNGSYLVEAAVAGVDPRELNVRATADDLLIASEARHHHGVPDGVTLLCEFSPGAALPFVSLPAGRQSGAREGRVPERAAPRHDPVR